MPLPPCELVDYHHAPYSKCGKPAAGWLSRRYPGNLCPAHRHEALFDSSASVWLLTLFFRELAYKGRWYGLGTTSDEPPGLVAQICPTCHGHGEIWVEPPEAR